MDVKKANSEVVLMVLEWMIADNKEWFSMCIHSRRQHLARTGKIVVGETDDHFGTSVQ